MGTGERVYSGSISQEKGFGSRTGKDSTGTSNQDTSFSHKPPSASTRVTNGNQDDFFDSWQKVVYNLDLY